MNVEQNDDGITVTYIAASVPVSRELLEDSGYLVPWSFSLREWTPEERAEHEAKQERDRAERADRQADWLAELGQDGPLGRIVGLHAPDEYGDCQGCGGDEYGTTWPCETWLIATGEDA